MGIVDVAVGWCCTFCFFATGPLSSSWLSVSKLMMSLSFSFCFSVVSVPSSVTCSCCLSSSPFHSSVNFLLISLIILSIS